MTTKDILNANQTVDPLDMLFIRRVPQSVKRKFQAHCKLAGITMTAGIIALVEFANQAVKSKPLFLNELVHGDHNEKPGAPPTEAE